MAEEPRQERPVAAVRRAGAMKGQVGPVAPAPRESAKPWQGRLHIGDHWALLDAQIGDNSLHRHLAPQWSEAVDVPLVVTLPGEAAVGTRAVLIAGGVAHRLGPPGCRVRPLYVEPQSELGRRFAQLLGGRPILVDAALDIAPMLERASVPPVDPRAQRLRELIERALPGTGPREWAGELGLSRSRLRAISFAAFGVPPGRLAQWLRLGAAARAMAGGAGLAEAAVAAGFADQAHFTRRMREWFGISPGRGLAGMEITVD